ncbi:LysM peptidoglycan-binding domain-containing protein [Phycicoccus sonneratiae]|uniref:LysM peptidoglycan-binding domain-containing protein n=1 Tax=Phycicoccus sonneratiae TaxID=2807628 RepID=A0ABS2CS42_9MICO|nr:LysM peptidoglycan-binding domain-containing protein [Phycicoccus sonneraticus]MBM6402298.1 LysM peptidoglycan-binding domain-containing protein [Phycicoccus sonneraticus]
MTTTRARLTGAAAALLLIAVVAGVPLALLGIGANPIPDSLPSWDQLRGALTSPDDGTLALAAITIVGWLAWAFLTAAIALEVASRLRRVPTPHLRGLALPQAAARGLVGSAVLLFAAAPAITSAPAAHAAVAHRTPVASESAATGTPRAVLADHERGHDSRTHTVTSGESLWSIAQDQLGSGYRWTQIADLNPDTVGNHPDHLRPGTVLRLPDPNTTAPQRTSHGRHLYAVQRGDTLSGIAQDQLGDPDRYPDIFAASRRTEQPDGRHLTDPDLILPGWTLTIPGTQPDEAGAVPPPALGPTRAPARHRATPSTPSVPTTPAAAAPTLTPEAPQHSQTARSAPDVTETEVQAPAPWLLAGLVGGPVLAGSLWMLLRRRRAAQFRHRRPGRTIATPPPALTPVEKTIATLGPTEAPALEHLDQVLRRLATERAAAGQPMPSVAAVELAPDAITLHFDTPAALPQPWTDLGQQTRWSIPTDTGASTIGPLAPDQPAPYPLLATIGTSDTGHTWLLNYEDLTLTLTGDPTYAADYARYLAAEIACNPWSNTVTLDCIGVATELAPLNPTRIRAHHISGDPAADVLADAVNTIDRARAHDHDAVTARAAMAGADTWPARLLLLDATAPATPELTQLIRLIHQHPGATGTSVVITTPDTTPEGITLELTPTGRARLPHAGLDLVAVGLTPDEAHGCAALIAASTDLHDAPMPVDDTTTDGWRSLTDEAGALRQELTHPRNTPPGQETEPTSSLLPAPDQEYLDAAATTTEDLATLAPNVPARLRNTLHDADATLDADLAAWRDDDCPLPRLTLLGPVGARTRGKAIAERKAYMTAVLAYLATRPHGATPDELAEAMGITPAKAREYARIIREWLGTNPRTGDKHLPDARQAPAAKTRGVGVYQVQDVLVDADLFRRLRARGQTRGTDGIPDLLAALDLVQGQPFSQLRPGAWTWLFEGERLDQHLTCAIVDVAHLVTTHSLQVGDIPTARRAAETSVLAAPFEDTPHLDIARVTQTEEPEEARDLLVSGILDRGDDGAPEDLPARTTRILHSREWASDERAG